MFRWFIVFCLVLSGFSARAESVLNSNEDSKPDSSAIKKTFFIPFGYYTPETKVALGFLGIINFDKVAVGKTSSLIASASQTFLGQSIFTLSPRFYLNGGVYELGGTLFYSYFPSKYYGQGATSMLESPEEYTENNFLSSVSLGWNFHSDFYLRSSLHMDLRKTLAFESGGRLANDLLAQNIRTEFLTLSLEQDRRLFPQSPKEGHLYRLTATSFQTLDRESSRSLSRFQRYDFEAREYFPHSEQQVFALQLLVSEIHGSGAQVPFQYLNSIGGPSRLRGFYNGRYRDRALALLQAENRLSLNDKWEAALFAGYGFLGASLDSRLKGLATMGTGLRYVIDKENRTVFRFDLGFGAEKMGVYVVIGEAF